MLSAKRFGVSLLVAVSTAPWSITSSAGMNDLLFLALLFGGTSAFANAKVDSFSLKSPLFAERGHGAEEALGDLMVCAKISHEKIPTISLSISMPDSGQVVTIKAPMTQKNNDIATFNFDDDGWGNSGKGKLQRKGDQAELEIEQTGAQPDANKNVRRNYGTYVLSRGNCD
jgi:hypothetical protein